MKNRKFTEAEVLNESFRADVLKEIRGPENVARKSDSRRRFDIYRDQIFKWVIARLSSEFSAETVEVMRHRATNISIAKKIVNKRAKCYANGALRVFVRETEASVFRRLLGFFKRKISGEKKETDSEVEDFSETMHAIGNMLQIDSKLKKADRYSELDRICTMLVAPQKVREEGVDKFVPQVRVIPAYGYDVIEDPVHPEQARCYILSDFTEPRNAAAAPPALDASPEGFAGVRGAAQTHALIASSGDGIDQTIADSRDDRDEKEKVYVWWTENYHFTTDSKGRVIMELSPDQLANPIKMLPFVDVHQDRDDSYWPEGGEDIVEGTVLVNVTLTDMFAILNYQGWGQLVVAGKGLKDNVKTGPNQAITFDMKDGDPEPVVEFKSANPPIDHWLTAIEMQIALILSTNDLSTRHVQGSLTADNVTSGVGKLVDDAELVTTVVDKQAAFTHWERKLWQLYRSWHNEIGVRNMLPRDLADVGKLADFDVTVKFPEAKPVLTEKEKVEMLTARKNLRISTLEDLVKMDNPDMSPVDVVKKVEDLRNDAIKNAWFYVQQRAAGGADAPGEDDEGQEEEGEAGEEAPPASGSAPPAGTRARREEEGRARGDAEE